MKKKKSSNLDKTQIGTKLKSRQNPNCDTTENVAKLTMLQN